MGLRRRTIVVAAVAASLLLAFGAAGCGSSSKSSTVAGLTKAQWLVKANAICVSGNAKTNAIGASLNRKMSQSHVIAIINSKFIPSIQAQINAIRALGAPVGGQTTVPAMLSTAQADLNKVKANPTLLFVNGPGPFAPFAKIAHPYGLTSCAKNA